MPRSLATTGAETTLTSCSIGRSRPGKRRRGQRLDLHLRDRALVDDGDLLDAGLGQLARERAELLGERDEGLQPRRFFRRDRGEVDGIRDRAAQQIIRHLVGDLQRDILLRLAGGGAEMRRADHVRMTEQRVLVRGLGREHVEGRAGDLSGIKRCAQSRLVDQAAARAIDDAHALFHRRDRLGVDDVSGLLGQRRMQRDEIGALEQIVKLDLLDAEIHRALRRQERIIGDHPHAQAQRAVGDDRADIAGADDAERLAGDLDAHEAVLLPLAGLGRSVGLRDLPRQRQHQRDRVLGGGDRIAERRVHHDDALGRRRRDIDIVDADAGAADDLQVLGLLQNFRRHLGGGADREAVIVADDGGELVLVLAEIGLEIDLDAAILENLHGGGRKSIGDQNFGGHGSMSGSGAPFLTPFTRAMIRGS